MSRIPDDPRFKHVNVFEKTDVRKTWARERARLKAIAEAEAKEKAEAAARQAAVDAEAAVKVSPLKRTKA